MNAADVIVAAVAEWRTGEIGTRVGDHVEQALRAACGGGDIVIRTDGTLATLFAHEYRHGWHNYAVVPVERGA